MEVVTFNRQLKVLFCLFLYQFTSIDNPRSVAVRFGKIYSLDGSAIDILTAVVRESMLANNVSITERSTSPSSTANEGLSGGSGKLTRQSARTEVDYSERNNSEWGANNYSRY